MKTYRVWAKMVDYCYLDVEAESMDEAIEMAYEADGGDFIPDESVYGGGDWIILDDSVEEIE